MAKNIMALFTLCCAGLASAATVGAVSNPATGIWINQKGDIVPQPDSWATLYYTKYSQNDRVKSLDYYYDGAGYLKLQNKKTLCTSDDNMAGADGIVHHPDGDLIVAAQGTSVHKVSKTAGPNTKKCVVKTSKTSEGVWHLMNDPNGKYVWAAGIPGKLHRIWLPENPAIKNMDSDGYNVPLTPKSTDRVQHHSMATLIWDEEGNAFFTYSDYMGGGCERNFKTSSVPVGYDFRLCNSSEKNSERAKSYFGYITDTTKVYIKDEAMSKQYKAPVGEYAITGLGTTILIDSLEGAHGGAYDKYSKTIFVFGGARIVQIKPYVENKVMKAKVVATIDLRDYFFSESYSDLTEPRTNDKVGWRLDQGTVDGAGHLFVASNTGHLVFVDYAANPNKYISDNVLVHLQWIDYFLDDLAPLTGVGVSRKDAETGEDSDGGSSSSHNLVVVSSSSADNSSSSSGGGGSSNKSSSSTGKSSSSMNGSSSSTGNSSGSTNSSGSKGSSSSTGNSSGSNGGSSGSTDNSSGSNGGSSGSTGGSSGSNVGSSGSTGGSSGSNGGSSGSTGSSGSQGGSTDIPYGSSSSGTQGGSTDIPFGSSSSNVYAGFTDFEISGSSGGIDFYPSQDKFDDGDSLVSEAVVLIPVDSVPGATGTVTIGENTYLVTNNPTGITLDLRYNANIDSAQVGQLVALKLDSAKIAELFGTTVDSLTMATANNLTMIDPKNPNPTDTVKVGVNGDVTIWVTADQVVKGGSIIVTDGNGRVVIIDNINFYDPVPDADKGYIKDSNGDDVLDFMEIVLKDTLEKGLEVHSVALVINGDTLKALTDLHLDTTSVNDGLYATKLVNTISMDVSKLKLSGEFPKDAFAVITYKNDDGNYYTRDVSVVEFGSQIIKAAYAIRNKHGKDSLFVEFGINIIPADLSEKEMLVALRQKKKDLIFFKNQISDIYMPTRNLVILVGDSLGLLGDLKDSVLLYPTAKFNSTPYITSDEYDRAVPVTVVDRLPAAVEVEYHDMDGDGSLDKIVTKFSGKLTKDDLKMLYMTFPWFSDRGMLVQLQAQPENLVLSADSMSVSWDVFATMQLAHGVTSISPSLPKATVFSYYPVLGEVFVTEEAVPLVDKMSPVIAAASLSYGSKADTLTVYFSEEIITDIEGRDFFSYIHGKDTIDLLPIRIDWAKDGMSAKLILDGSVCTILPGDSLMIVKGAKDVIQDNFGNIAGEHPSAVIIAGLLNHLVESTKMGSFDANSEDLLYGDEDSSKVTLQTVSSVNLRYVPSSTTKEDMEKKGALGQLVQLGERFVPQLLDNAQFSADGTVDPSVLDSLDPAKVYITFVVNYYDHLGQYVNDTTIIVPCNSPKFGGNCLATDQKVFVNWNFKDHNGRFVGSGVYNVQFKMIVRYEKKKIEEEIKNKWGVRRKKKK